MNDCPVPVLPLDPVALAYIGLAFGTIGFLVGVAVMRSMMLDEVDALLTRLETAHEARRADGQEMPR